MLSLHDRPLPPWEGPNRREWLRVGGLSLCGLSLPAVLRGDQQAAPAPEVASKLGAATFGKAKNIIFLWLQGGPPQHETFDPKPDAPAEIRGPFKPIQTTVPGLQFCELLPRTARIAHKLAVIRSMHTDDDSHDVSGYWVLTGYPYPGASGTARQIKPTDWPYFGSVVKMLKPSETMPALTSVWIPDVMRLNDSVTPAGQTAGFLGKQWEPERFVGDPAEPNYQIEGVTLPQDVSVARFDRRQDLLGQLDAHRRLVETGGQLESWSRLSRNAFDLVTSGKAREAFDLRKEPESTRDRYGRHSWGQSVLLARRLVEAGVRLVHVNWPREGGDSAVDNPMWDTHAGNADRLQDCLCPQFDVTFPALIDDLSQRGMLDETLVVAVGEFGRTPKINGVGGRDHWGRVFSVALAGAGIAGGAVLGSSDKPGAVPTNDPVRPQDLTATMFHLLGVNHHAMFPDKTNRPVHATTGQPLDRVLGSKPLPKLAEPGGEVAFLPPYDDRKLLDLNFASGKLTPCSPPSRDKGWRANVLWSEKSPNAFSVKLADGATLGFGKGATIAVGARLLLAQGIRHGRGGDYTLSVRAALTGDADTFAKHFTCWLTIFRFADVSLNPMNIQDLGTVEIKPGRETKEYSIQRFLGSTTPGANFAIGNGLGVAISVRKDSPGDLAAQNAAHLHIESVALRFSARPRNENVVD
jgi:hypothetical protein